MIAPAVAPFAEEAWVVVEASIDLDLMTVGAVPVSMALATEMVARAGVMVLEAPLEVLVRPSRAEASRATKTLTKSLVAEAASSTIK